MGGGFYHEVTSKYDIDTFHLFQALFIHLPIGATLGGQAFVVHGGLMREDDLDMKRLTTLEHRRPCPEAPTDDDELLMFDALWADPQEESGLHIGPRRQHDPMGPRRDARLPSAHKDGTHHSVAPGAERTPRLHDPPRREGAHHLLRLELRRCLMNRGAVLVLSATAPPQTPEHMAPPLAELRQAYFAEKLSSSSLAGARRWRLRAAHRGLAKRVFLEEMAPAERRVARRRPRRRPVPRAEGACLRTAGMRWPRVWRPARAASEEGTRGGGRRAAAAGGVARGDG